MTGRIKTIKADKGYGFIIRDDGAKDIFFHISGMAHKEDFAALRTGQSVEFDVESSNKGPRAVRVSV